MTELEEVERVPDSAVENGSTFEFASDERVIVKWQDDDGTLYTEEFVRNGPPRKEVEEDN
jgi:hypothetical protein